MNPYLCKGCYTKIATKVNICPKCGLSKPKWGTAWIWLLTIFIYIGCAKQYPSISVMSLVVGGVFIFIRGRAIRMKRKVYLPSKTNPSKQKDLNKEISFYKKMAANRHIDTIDKNVKAKNYVSADTLWTGNVEIEFSYKDSVGNYSRRIITLKKVEQNNYGDLYLGGYCSERGEYRTFKVSSIKSKIKYSGVEYSVSEFIDNF